MPRVASMTGFARAASADSAPGWVWEVRSVNGRGLDLRLKLPPGFDGLEPRLRAAATARFARGTINAGLAMRRDEMAVVTVDRALLARLAAEAASLAETFPAAPPPRIESLMALPGVIRRDAAEERAPDEATLAAALADFDVALGLLAEMRAAEGARLAAILATLLDRMAELRDSAADSAAQQPEAQKTRLSDLLARLLGESGAVPPERLAQEVALLAARADVTEEIDRLGSHIAAARDLLARGGAIGRQLDFLVQEFMREANTLCSKSASGALTAAGLQLKVVIEQFREQIQNVE